MELGLGAGRQDPRRILDQEFPHRRVVDAAPAQSRQDRAEDVTVARAAEPQQLDLRAHILRYEQAVAEAGFQQLDEAVDALAITWLGRAVAVEVRLLPERVVLDVSSTEDDRA